MRLATPGTEVAQPGGGPMPERSWRAGLPLKSAARVLRAGELTAGPAECRIIAIPHGPGGAA